LHLIHTNVLEVTLNATRRGFHKAFIHVNQKRLTYRKKKGERKMKRISTVLIILLLTVNTFAVILPQVKAASETIEWKGWWVDLAQVSEAYVGEMVTAQVRILNEPSGYYRVQIWKDYKWSVDVEGEKLEFDYDGGDHTYSLSFDTLVGFDEDLRGYYVVVDKKEWWGWAEKWAMASSYPPRLTVLKRELWIELTNAPNGIGAGGDVEYHENTLYVLRGGNTKDFWKVDLNTLSWTTLASAPEEVTFGGGMTFDGDRYIYGTRGSSRAFWRYDLEQNIWTDLPDTPQGMGAVGSIVYADSYVYLRPGGSLSAGFYRYNTDTQTWETKASGPRVAIDTGPSTALTYDGNRYIYTFQGGQNLPPAEFLYDDVWRYDISTDSWLRLEDNGYPPGENFDRADLLYVDEGLYAISNYGFWNFEFLDLPSKKWFARPNIPCGAWSWECIGDGAGLAYDGAQYIYTLNGGNNKRIWRYRIYKAPDFFITAEADQILYKPQQTTDIKITVKNNRGVATTFWLGVNFKDPTGDFARYTEQISTTPSSATLDPSQSTTFSVTWTIPSDAPIGYYQIAVNCGKDSAFEQCYLDDFDWASIFYVHKLNILTPISSAPAMAGDPSNPNEVLISVEWIPRWLLFFKTLTFSVKIDDQPATCELVDPWNQPIGIYTLRIVPPTMLSEGLCNLNVAATFGESADSDIEEKAIKYVTSPSPEPIQKGLAWLRTQQYGDGSWRSSVGVAALCALTFLNAGFDESDSTVQKAIQYLLSNARSDGSIYSSYATYETSLALIALVATHNSAYQAKINSARDWLVNSQWDESCTWGSVNKDSWYYGGFGYGWNVRPDLSNSQFALLALDASGLPKDNSAWIKAQVFLHRTQNINFPITLNIEGSEYTVQPYNTQGGYDGGFIYYPGASLAGDQKSYGSMTGAGIWGLLLSGVPKTDARVVAAMEWVKNHYTWDTNPGIGWWRPYYYYLSMSKALTMYGQTMIDGHDWYQELYDKIVGVQIDAGSGKGYWSTSAEDYNPQLTTAYAILSLQTRAVAPPVQRLSYLTFILRSNCLIRILDSEGNLVGYNYMTGLGENQIPTAIYSGPFSEPQYIVIINPEAGTYKLELIGVSEGPYTLTIQGNYGEDVTDTFEYTGEIKPAELHGSEITVTAIVGPIDIYANPPEFEEIIDNIPPTTTREIGEPKYVDPMDNIYVTSATLFTLTAEDNPGGTGVESIFYRIYDAGWLEYSAPFYLTGLSDGEYSIDYYSTDIIGNTESTHTITVTLDNSGPLIVVENPPAGWALQDGVTFIASASDSSGTHGLNFSIREANGDQGIPVGFEDIPATYDAITGRWNWYFNTLQLPDGYYIVLVNAEDNLGHTASITVPYSIRNWAILERLPSTPNSKAGRTMPVKFALRVAASVDPTQPFVYNEELTIKIYATDKPNTILQTSTFGETSQDYRIDIPSEKYHTNFKTLSTPKTYRVEIWRKDMLIGSFEFKTVK